MKIVSLICLAGVVMLVWFLLAAKEKGTYAKEDVPEKFTGLWVFWRAGDLLAGKTAQWRRRLGFGSRAKYERICSELYLRESGADTLRKLEAGRYGIALMILLLALALGLAAGLAGQDEMSVTSLPRNAAGGGPASYDLRVRGLEDEEVPLTVVVEEQRCGDVEALFEEARTEAERELFAEGDTADEARHDLHFPTRLCSGLVRASWESGDPSIVRFDGTLDAEQLPEEGRMVELYLTMRYEDEEEIVSIPVRICPPAYTEEEERLHALTREIREREEEGRGQDDLELPDEMDGRELEYVSAREDASPLQVLLVGAVGAGLWFLLSFRKLEDRAQERTEQMQRDYPEVVLKLAILLRAGLTVRGAWERITANYRERLDAGTGEKRYVYEEMHQALIRVMSGRPETEAYLEFGRRTHLHCYLKLSSLLEQNLRKGGKNLVMLLESESDQAWHERRNTALKKGEEAGTKMVLPMMLNMVVVMMVIMIPAMLSFY